MKQLNAPTNVENTAQRFRELLRLSDIDCLDPFLLSQHLGLEIIGIHDIPDLPEWARSHLLKIRPDAWSAGTIEVTGRMIVLLNFTHSRDRMNATLMEEICHVELGHTPSSLTESAEGSSLVRSFDDRQEREAYAIGAAALVPYTGLKRLVNAKDSIRSIADRYRVSPELVRFRLKVTRLWRQVERIEREGNYSLFPSLGLP